MEIITIKTTIIDQMNKFFKNNFNLEFVSKNAGMTRIRTAIKKITDINWSIDILAIPKTFYFLKKFSYTRI